MVSTLYIDYEFPMEQSGVIYQRFVNKSQIKMGVCFLQHRVVIGNNNRRYCKSPTNSRCLLSGWYDYFNMVYEYLINKRSLYTISSVLYFYIVLSILIIVTMTVDIDKVSVGGRTSMISSFSQHHFGYDSLFTSRDRLAQKLLILLTFLCDQGINKMKLSSFKMKGGMFSKMKYILSYWLAALNLILIVVCNPAILNPGPLISGVFQNVRGFVPFSGLGENILPLDVTKVQEFQSYIFDKNPGIVVLNETWLSNEHFDNEIFPNDTYRVFRLDRSLRSHPPDPTCPNKYRKRGGGILVAVRSALVVESKRVGCVVNAEILSVEIKIGNDIFCLTTCYRVGTLGAQHFGEVEKHLRSISSIKKYKKHVFLGDLNLNSVAWPEGYATNEIEKRFVDLFNDLGMQQLVNDPTHDHGRILDLAYESAHSIIKNLKVLNKNEICSSDHFGIAFSLDSRARLRGQKRKIPNFKKANWASMIAGINSVNWGRHFRNCDPNEGWLFLKKTLALLEKNCIPTITIKDKDQPPWFDSEAFYLCKKKERLRKKYKESGRPEDYTKFSDCRKKFKNLMKSKMAANLNDDVNDPALVSKKFWGHVKSTCKSTRIPESMHYKDTIRNDSAGQAEIFNDFFVAQFSEFLIHRTLLKTLFLERTDIDIDQKKTWIKNIFVP